MKMNNVNFSWRLRINCCKNFFMPMEQHVCIHYKYIYHKILNSILKMVTWKPLCRILPWNYLFRLQIGVKSRIQAKECINTISTLVLWIRLYRWKTTDRGVPGVLWMSLSNWFLTLKGKLYLSKLIQLLLPRFFDCKYILTLFEISNVRLEFQA